MREAFGGEQHGIAAVAGGLRCGGLGGGLAVSAWPIKDRAALSIAAARRRTTGSRTRRWRMARSTGPGRLVLARLSVNDTPASG